MYWQSYLFSMDDKRRNLSVDVMHDARPRVYDRLDAHTLGDLK